MPINETSRQEALANLGIQTYVPRFILPGASPAPGRARAQEDPRPQQPAVAREAVPEAPAAERAVAKPAAPTLAKGEDVRFQLAFIRVNERICALNQMPYAGVQQQPGGAQRKLFANLCRALGLDAASIGFDQQPFRWPFSESAHIDKSLAAARASLQAYLGEKQRENGFRVLLVMGEQLAAYIGDQRAEGPDPVEGDWRLFYTRSLDELLKMPALKAEAWQRLRPLSADVARG